MIPGPVTVEDEVLYEPSGFDDQLAQDPDAAAAFLSAGSSGE
jgi:hypothetical protein